MNSAPRNLEFCFDLSSPYSYLAATQVEAIAARHGAIVAYKPVVLGAVFKAAGNRMPAQVPAKARHMALDLQRWAARYDVPFRFSSRFPVNAIQAMRLVLVGERHGRAGEVAMAAFRALWVDDRDITDPAELRAIAQTAGLDPDQALAALGDPEIKDRLRALTDEAVERGVFGAPAIFVGGELFWGNDRMHFVEAALARPA